MTEQPTDFFWEVSAVALTHADVAIGTMASRACAARARSLPPATTDPATSASSSPRHRVRQLIQSGGGQPFAPAGRAFREWILIADRDPARWTQLIDEARVFAGEKS